ncbi:MAG: ester cyclase [Solirubrobacterales bacterium]
MAWNSRGPDQVLALCAPDVLWHDPLTDGREQGPRAVRRYLESLWTAFPDMKLEWVEAPLCSLDAGRVACRWRMTGTMLGSLEPPGFAPTRRHLDAEGIDVFALADGLVRGYEGFFDARAMAQQIGLLPATGSVAERIAVTLQRITARVARRAG